MSDPATIQHCLAALADAHKILHAQEGIFRAEFTELLKPFLSIGKIVDKTEPGPAYNAGVKGGRAYGNYFRILGQLRIGVDTSRPSLSKWTALAISVKDPHAADTLGRPFTLSGYVVPGPRSDEGSENEVIQVGVEWLRANA